MKSSILCFAAILLWINSMGQPKPAHNEALDAYIAKEMKETGTLGMAVAVIKNGRILHSNTYGLANIEYGIPVSPRTNFAIASATKLFTSSLLMKWVQSGKISLEDPIGKFIPEAPKWQDIKIQHLLAHEGGIVWPGALGGYLGIGASSEFKVEPIETVIKQLKDSSLVFPPGSKQAYQNGDYFVLQYIIEKIAGEPIETVLKKELLLPMQMLDGGFDVEYRGFPFQTMYPIPNKSQNFTKGKNGPLVFKGYYSPASFGAGGMFLSLSDLCKWAISLDRQTILKKEIQDVAVAATGLKGGFSKMGWAIQNNNGLAIAGHSGGPGLADILRVPQDNFTVIVLSNNADLYAYLAGEILKMYYPNYKPEKMPKSFTRKLVR
ncbi:serine hydrolase domain-containing protein [Sphingobacterium thalpophilum]|uniref:Serine hydrolase domain-containing protein n=1 Tax=Sphingobacterium thalpophilum TaxID=259 RepID=A0ABV4HH31_9SPHI